MFKSIGKIVGALALVVLVGAGCAGGSTSTSEDGPIQIGFVGPLTGDAAELGNDALVAAQLAVDEVNAAGGVDGRMLELIAEDGKCSPKDASTAGNKLINIDGVSVIIGGLCSGETSAIAPAAESNEVVLFSTCSTAPTITEAGDFVFRSAPSDSFQGVFIAEYLYNELGIRKAAVLSVLGDWGEGLNQVFTNRFTELGGEVVFAENYVQESRDFRTQLTKIKNTDAEMVFFPGYTEATIAMLKQATELGLEIPLFGGDAWSDPAIHTSQGAEGIRFAMPQTGEQSEAWVASLEAAGGNNTFCAPRGYDNVRLIAALMEDVGTDGPALRDALYQVEGYMGEGGVITIDENGDLSEASFVVNVVENGEAVPAK